MSTVIFDMDGVIFDSERASLACWQELGEQWGLTGIEAVFVRCIGTDKRQTQDIVENAYAGRFGDGIAKRLLAESSALFHARYDGGRLPMKTGVREILNFLRRREVRIGMASSTGKATVERELEAAGLLGYFDRIVGGDEVRVSKPAPEIYERACRALAADPAETFAVEDSYNGIRSAHAAGMRAIMVPDFVPADDEMRGLAEVVCRDLPEVQAYLAKQLDGRRPGSGESAMGAS